MKTKEIWIQHGYECFAYSGPSEIKIETLARNVAISKSSFYHHFVDLEYFQEHLLDFHLAQCKIIAEKERTAQNIHPELIDILVEHKTDLLFNRQLRFNQQYLSFEKTLQQANRLIGNEFVKVWAKDLRLNLTESQLEALFELALENFFLRINPENIRFDWLTTYFNYLKNIAKKLDSKGIVR